jgi:hypothetical protein
MFTRTPASPTILWKQWAGATVTGFVVGGILGTSVGYIAVYPIVFVLFWMHLLGLRLCGNNQGSGIVCIVSAAALAGVITVGAVVGVAQWLVLRRVIRRSKWWILASTLGWPGVAVTMMGCAQSTILENPASMLLAVTRVFLAAAFLGFLQWLVLRLSLRWAVWWVLMNILVWLIDSAIMVLAVRGGSGVLGACFLFVGSLYPVISGIVLGKLIRFRQV